MLCILVHYREIYHGKRWREDPLYQAPMVHTGLMDIYVGDFVLVTNPVDSCSGVTCSKVVRFYMKVQYSLVYSLALSYSCNWLGEFILSIKLALPLSKSSVS